MSELYYSVFRELRPKEGQPSAASSARTAAEGFHRIPVSEQARGARFEARLLHHGMLKSSGVRHIAEQWACVVNGAPANPLDARSTLSPEAAGRHLAARAADSRNCFAGNYALVFHDLRADRLFAEADLLGVYPLYYRETALGLAISSDIKSLSMDGCDELCVDAAGEVLRFGYVVSDLTLVRGIRRLIPGHRLIWERGRVRVEQLQATVFGRSVEPDDSFYDALHEAFDSAIQRYSSHGRPAFCSLSGGLDSRLVTLGLKDAPIASSAWSAGERNSLDVEVAERFAQAAGVPMQVHYLDGSSLPQWFDASVRITEGRVPLGHIHFLEPMMSGRYPEGLCAHGLIGDIIMGGDLEDGRLAAALQQPLSDGLLSLMSSFVYWPRGIVSQLLSGPLLRAYEEANDRVMETIGKKIVAETPYEHLLQFRYRYRVHGFTIPCLMAQVLPWSEPMVPYLDRRVIELCASVSKSAINDRALQIEFARRFYPKTFEIPRVKDGVLVGWPGQSATYERQIRRSRTLIKLQYYLGRVSLGRFQLPLSLGYPHYDSWYRKYPGVRRYVHRRVTESSLCAAGLVDPKSWETLMQWQRQGRNAWDAIGTVLGLSVFMDEFLVGRAGTSAAAAAVK